MRVLFLTSRDWMDPHACGGDQHTTDYARYLAAKGHAVTLLAARHRGSAREEVVEGVRIVRPTRMFLLALYAPLFYWRHRHEFDAVYEEGLASARLPYLAPLYVRKPIVAIWYQVNAAIFRQQYPAPLAWLLTRAERLVLALHRDCCILTPSSDRRRDLLTLGFLPTQVEVMPSLMLESRPKRVPRREREPLVVWLGKVRRYKCPHHAVEAMPRLVRQVPGARLVIAGKQDDRAYEADLLKLAERLGVKQQVEVRVNLSDGEKWDLLARAKALVVTSPVEGFGIVILEANLCGTPVVATEGTPMDTVRHGHNGYRVPFHDPEALAAALTRLLTDETRFRALSRNARRHAGSFSAESVGRRLEEIFDAATARAA